LRLTLSSFLRQRLIRIRINEVLIQCMDLNIASCQYGNEVLIQCMDLNIASRQYGIQKSELPDLHQKAIKLLDLLQKNLPEKTGRRRILYVAVCNCM
jgi:hypothetical protein